MPKDSGDPYFANRAHALLAEQSAEMQSRGVVFHTDFDPDLVLARRSSASPVPPEVGAASDPDPGEQALRALVRFVMATVPDGCEVYFAAARPAVPVAAVGAGVLTLRWQVAGDRRGGTGTGVVGLRPRLGDAQTQVVGPAARALRAGFEAVGWSLALEAIQGGQEIWARAEIS